MSLASAQGGYLLPYFLDPTIVITTDGTTNPYRKIANIRDNPAVCIAFDEYSDDWDHGLFQVIVYGDAYLVESGPEFDRDAALLNEKFPQYAVSTYPIEVGSTVIIEIRIVRVSSFGL